MEITEIKRPIDYSGFQMKDYRNTWDALTFAAESMAGVTLRPNCFGVGGETAAWRELDALMMWLYAERTRLIAHLKSVTFSDPNEDEYRRLLIVQQYAEYGDETILKDVVVPSKAAA